MASGSDLLEIIEKYIKENKVMIFSKSRCPYCIKVKELFKSLGEEYCALELDTADDGDKLQDAMAVKCGRRTVPQVFVNEQHIGGCDDTMAAHKSGKLAALLK